MHNLDIRITVYPPIPAGDVTPLEALVLSSVLEVSEADEGLIPFTDLGPTNPIKVSAPALIDAYEASKQHLDSTLNAFISSRVLALLPGGTVSPDALLEIDLASFPWQFVVQDIVARSDTLREVVVIQWINHPSQRPETFGASVSLITAKGIHHATSTDLIERFRMQDEVLPSRVLPSSPAAPIPALAPAPASRPDSEDSEPVTRQELEAALCIWEALLYFRGLHEERRPVSETISQMSKVWDEVGWQSMRRFAAAVAAFALDVQAHLQQDLDEDGFSFDFEFIPAFVEALLWSPDGPYREGEPEEFLEEVVNILHRRRGAAVAAHMQRRDPS